MPLAAALFAVLLFGGSVEAGPVENVVHLRDGAVLRGQVVRYEGGELVLRTQYGEIRVPESAIARIEGESPVVVPPEPGATPAPTPAVSTPAPATAPRRSGGLIEGTGVWFGADLGLQIPRGNFYGNRFEQGGAFRLHGGWRFHPQLSVESAFAFGAGRVDRDEVDGGAAYVHFLNADFRWYPPLELGPVQPSLLAGWTVLSVMSFATRDETQYSYGGYSPTIGAGFRMRTQLARFFVSGDVRYHFTRYQTETIDDGSDGTPEPIPMEHQRHGDTIQFLAGAGFQF